MHTSKVYTTDTRKIATNILSVRPCVCLSHLCTVSNDKRIAEHFPDELQFTVHETFVNTHVTKTALYKKKLILGHIITARC